MRHPKPLPAAVQGWAEQRIGPIVSVRDASHDWDRSRDAVNCLAWGPENGDELVTARGRRTLDRLMRESGS